MHVEHTPFDHVLFRSPSIQIGRFWVPLDERRFPDTGAIRNHILVVPTWSVEITYSRREAVVAESTRVMCYNRGCEFRRRALNRHGDQCLWVAFEDQRLAEVIGSTPEAPFATRSLPLPREAFLAARLLGARLQGDEVADDLEVEERAWDLLGHCLDTHAGAPRPSPHQQRAMNRARAFVAEHYRDRLTLGEVAAAACLSPYHLSRCFRRFTGQSLHGFLVELRLRESVHDLIEGGQPLTRMAADLGFASPSHFSSSFRNAFGVSPSALRSGRLPA